MIREFACLEHGPFEGSHAICPAYGCDSRAVSQEFRTAPKIGSALTRRTDAGLRKSAEMYGINNWKSGAREGDMSFAGHADKALGMEVLWGNEVQKKMGRSFTELSGLAQKPLVVPKRDGSGVLRLDRNNAMREAATEAGITRRRLPKAAEVSGAPDTPKARAQALTV